MLEKKTEGRYELALRKLTADIRRHIRSMVGNAGDLTDELVAGEIDSMILDDPYYTWLSTKAKIELTKTVFHRVRSPLSVIQTLADDREVSEIMVNGKDDIFIERKGVVSKVAVTFENTEELEEVIRRIAAGVHREVNELTPILDARLKDGSRVNAVYKNIAINGPILTIRKFPESAIGMADLIRFGSVTTEAAEYLTSLVRAKYNIFISGGTSSGKTTFLNALSNYIPSDERIVTIEDSAELQITSVKNIAKLECKSANVQDRGEVNMKQLIKSSLRMRPDRIIVGEVRGEEVIDMIQAMNTGHAGSLSTGHGNSPRGMIYRLEAMFLQAADYPIEAIRRQICEGIDVIVHLGKLPGGGRSLLSVCEITEMKDGEVQLSELFAYETKSGLKRTKTALIDTSKLSLIGLKETEGKIA
jgi:pilus assembly protein CpaF